jgi:hypothetical protein
VRQRLFGLGLRQRTRASKDAEQRDDERLSIELREFFDRHLSSPHHDRDGSEKSLCRLLNGRDLRRSIGDRYFLRNSFVSWAGRYCASGSD